MLAPAQEMNQQLARENDAMTAWVYSNNSGELAIVQAAKGMAHESETFEGFMHGLRESSVSAGALTVVDEKLTAGLPPYRYRLSANRPDGVAVDFYCASPAQEQGVAGLIVCVTTFAADHIELRGFRESVRFDSCT